MRAIRFRTWLMGKLAGEVVTVINAELITTIVKADGTTHWTITRSPKELWMSTPRRKYAR